MITQKDIKDFERVIQAFAADFDLMTEDISYLDMLKNKIEDKDQDIMKDIDILNQLDFYLRHKKIKIVIEEV